MKALVLRQQCRFEALAAGDVPDDREHPGQVAQVDHLDRHLEVHPMAGLVEDHRLVVVVDLPSLEAMGHALL
ncbi:hypothetical protein D3C72_1924800 [compost metagenome]